MNNKAFTLIEMMIVVVIIIVLASLILPSINKARIESKQTYAQSTLNTIGKALEIYNAQNMQYPDDINVLYSEGHIREDYFDGEFRGYNYEGVSYANSYLVTAKPTGKVEWFKEFVLTTGGNIH